MVRQSKKAILNSIPLVKAVLCADCECISESRTDVCPVCGGRSLVNLGRLLGSALHAEASAALSVSDPLIHTELEKLVDSAEPQNPRAAVR